MKVQIWIMIQILIDFGLVVLLVGYLRIMKKRILSWQEHEEIVKRSEAILAEMKQIGLMLEKNLNEKREISQHLLAQMDEGLAKARENFKKVNSLNERYGDAPKPIRKDDQADGDLRQSIEGLLKNGYAKEAVAKQLHISLGEVELFLNLHLKEKGVFRQDKPDLKKIKEVA